MVARDSRALVHACAAVRLVEDGEEWLGRSSASAVACVDPMVLVRVVWRTAGCLTRRCVDSAGRREISVLTVWASRLEEVSLVTA